MTAFSAIRQLRKAVSQIGSAVSASQEYSRAATAKLSPQGDDRSDLSRYLPL